MNDLLARDEIDKHLRISYHKKLWIWTQNFTISFQHSFPSCFFVELQPVWWVYAQLSTLIKHQPVFHFHFALINRSRRCFPFHSWFILMPKRERFSFSFSLRKARPERKQFTNTNIEQFYPISHPRSSFYSLSRVGRKISLPFRRLHSKKLYFSVHDSWNII